MGKKMMIIVGAAVTTAAVTLGAKAGIKTVIKRREERLAKESQENEE